jgi:catechol 2,3-dioxygenase-like lactoylglutathione lyase family enzyme
MVVELFAGMPVSDYDRAVAWYTQLLGTGPSFVPNATEAVWELAEGRYLYVDAEAQPAGHALATVFVDDLDTLVSAVASRGLEPDHRETYSNGVRKVLYRDPDGNEVGFGGGPAGAP